VDKQTTGSLGSRSEDVFAASRGSLGGPDRSCDRDAAGQPRCIVSPSAGQLQVTGQVAFLVPKHGLGYSVDALYLSLPFCSAASHPNALAFALRMTAQILAAELGTLIQDSKRKNSELRSAAEKSLQDLKALPVTSEAQLAAGNCTPTGQEHVLTIDRPLSATVFHFPLFDCL
jgi:hypothetical protein